MSCYYGDICPDSEICDNYISLVDDDDFVDDIIEQTRVVYRAAWFEYIKYES